MSIFFCRECGGETTKWSGKCPFCGAWNSLAEDTRVIGRKKKARTAVTPGGPVNADKPQPLSQIEFRQESRIQTGWTEFDGTLGGGIVPGMVVLIGGEPGVGKSTLMLQVGNKLSGKDKRTLYISGEESKEQIRLRSKRLQCNSENLYLYCETGLEEILETIREFQPGLLIIDSVQSVYSEAVESAPGSISQLRECTAQLTRLAKSSNIPVFLIGHVTKDGTVAGPKIIEHMVDTVLYFEGDDRNQFKILRAAKNRFGSTNEIGIFEMRAEGVVELKNPSQYFISSDEAKPGTALGCIVEGSRAFLAEVQALVSPAGYGYSQRVALGLDHKKLAVLVAIIEKNLSLNLNQSDVFINISGGLRINDPALDMTIIAAILSSYQNQAFPEGTLFIGEVGLNGYVKPASQLDKRLKEAEKLGYRNIYISRKNRIKAGPTLQKLTHISQIKL